MCRLYCIYGGGLCMICDYCTDGNSFMLGEPNIVSYGKSYHKECYTKVKPIHEHYKNGGTWQTLAVKIKEGKI